MKNKITVASLNVSQAALLSGKTRETVSRAARELQSVNGARNAKFFDSRELPQALYLGTTGPTYSEAQRLLALSRRAFIDYELEEKKARMVPIEQYRRDFQHLVALFRASLLSRMNKTIDNAMLSSCQNDLQEYLVALAPDSERTALRKTFCERELDEAASHIEWLKRDVARDKWHADCDAAGERLREAYHATLSDKSEAALERLEQARAEMRAAMDAEPGRPRR
jgi:hypothetical protein